MLARCRRRESDVRSTIGARLVAARTLEAVVGAYDLTCGDHYRSERNDNAGGNGVARLQYALDLTLSRLARRTLGVYSSESRSSAPGCFSQRRIRR